MVEKPIKQQERPPDIVKESSPSTSSGDILESQSSRNNSDTLRSVSPHPAPSLDCSNVLSRLGLQTVTSERGGGDGLPCVTAGRVYCPNLDTVAPLLRLAGMPIINYQNKLNNAITDLDGPDVYSHISTNNLALRGGADPVAEEVRFACHRCPSILRMSSVTAHISNCAQHESFFVDGPGLKVTLEYIHTHLNGRWICTKDK